MPKKNILISSGSAKRWSAPGNRLTYDTDTRYISIDNLSSSQLVLTGAISGVLINSGGVITSYKAADYSGSYLVTNGSVWTVGSAGNASIGPVSGDISGSYPNPRFSNINNINTGSLPVARGGFSGSNNYNLLSSIPSGSLILASGTGSLTVVSTASYVVDNDYVLASVSGSSVWASVTASAPERDANVQYFTCSNPLISSIQTWTKQNLNHQWARVMLQGGGGGGGGNGTANAAAAAGGGAGGFTDITVYVGNISSATITVGAGSTGSTTFAIRANTGNSSSFSASNIFVSANGGGGGIYGNVPGGVGGIGLTFNGSAGGNGGFTNAQITPGADGPGASGGGGGGYSPSSATEENGGIAGLYTTNTIAPAGNGTYTPNLFGYNMPIGFGTGGRGGAEGVSGFSGVFGGGGGGSGRYASTPTSGGNGGSGFVVVISF